MRFVHCPSVSVQLFALGLWKIKTCIEIGTKKIELSTSINKHWKVVQMTQNKV